MNYRKSLVYFLIILLSTTSLASLLAPTQAETWTDITLPYTITASGNYRITAAYNGSGIALSINASDVVVDGQDKLIQLTQTVDECAIVVDENRTNILLMNINQTSADYGVGLFGQAENVTVQDSMFTNNTSAGMFAFNSSGVSIQNSRLSNNSYGLVTVYSNDTSVVECHIKNNTIGIQPVLGHNITLTGSYLNNNTNAMRIDEFANINVSNSTFDENTEGLIAQASGNLTCTNCNFINNPDVGIAVIEGNFTADNCLFNNTEIAVYAIYSNYSISNSNITNSIFGLASLACYGTIENSHIDYNLYFGLYMVLTNMTLSNCSVNNNRQGILSEGTDNFFITNCDISNNTRLGVNDYYGNNTQISQTTFSYNGDSSTYTNGALMLEDTNCTIVNNVFDNNFDALLLGIYDDETNNTQIYHTNIFTNNSYTFDFNYQLPSNYTNQQIYFYNNLVNDTGYVNPDSYTGTDPYVPSSTVFHLNTTFQSGERIYSDGRMIGGNYWAHPNGTGYSENATDANMDGFADEPFDFFGNSTVYDYLPYTSEYVENIVNLVISPLATTIKAGENVTFTTTAYDEYGNSWLVDAAYLLDGTSYTSDTFVGHTAGIYYITAVYGDNSNSTTVTVTPRELTQYGVLVPYTATPGEGFTIRVKAWDNYYNTVTDFDGSVTLTLSGSSIDPVATGDFTNGVWTGTVTIADAGTYKITATDSHGNTGTSISITVSEETPSPTATPTPTTTTQPTPNPTVPSAAADEYWWATPAAIIIAIALVAIVLAILLSRRAKL